MSTTEIPTEQNSFVIKEFRKPLKYTKIPVKKPGPGEILINIKYSGVCHSDVHAMKGDWALPPKLPVVGGHEGAGVIVALGEGVTEFEIGDHAGIKWFNGTCTKCPWCKAGDEILCSTQDISGYTVNGSFQQYAIAKAFNTAKIPKDMDLAACSPIMCAGVTAYTGLKRSKCRPGQYCAIVGAAGGLGCYGIQYAKAMGMRPIAIDSGADKGKTCLELGAESYIDISTSKDIITDLKAATADGFGPHAAVIVSSEEEPFSHFADYVRPRGTVVVVGIPSEDLLESTISDAVFKVITLKASLVGNLPDLLEALEFARRGLINVPYQVVGLSKLNEVMDLLDKDKVVGRYVVDTSK